MALYNKMRSRNFLELKGQEKAVTILKAVLKENRIPNALLLVGVKGTGKTSVARIFARAVNCEHPTEDGPCNECQSCREILAGSSMDVLEMDAASNNSVDDVHELIKKTQYVPLHKKKVFIMDEFHMLSQAAFNAMLKTIEEPNENCLFIFCTTEEHKVPATIKSRCMRIVFDRIDDEVVFEHLKYVCEHPDYHIPYEEDALKLIARKAGGSMRDALSMLDPFLNGENVSAEVVAEQLGISQEENLFTVLTGIGEGDIPAALSALQDTIKHGGDIKAFLQDLMQACIDLIYAEDTRHLDDIVCTRLYRAYLESVAGMFEKEMLLHMVDELSKVYGNARYTSIEFAAETTIISLISSETDISEMKKEISLLKEEIRELKEHGITVLREETGHFPATEIENEGAGEEPIQTAAEDSQSVDGIETEMQEEQPQEEKGFWEEAGEEALNSVFPEQEGQPESERVEKPSTVEKTEMSFQTDEREQQPSPEQALPAGAVIGDDIRIDTDTGDITEERTEREAKEVKTEMPEKGEEAFNEEDKDDENDFFFDFFKASFARR